MRNQFKFSSQAFFRLSVRIGVVLSLGIGSPLFAQEDSPSEQTYLKTQKVVLQGLDKVTARVFTIQANVGQEITFGNLRILVKDCRVTPPEEVPETLAFLQIDEMKPGEARKRIFSGWMFGSNPALHGLEHPVYDVWVKEGVRNTAELQGLSEGEDTEKSLKSPPKPCATSEIAPSPEDLVDCPEPAVTQDEQKASEDHMDSLLTRLKEGEDAE